MFDVDRLTLSVGLLTGIIVGGGLALLFGSVGFLAAIFGGLIRLGYEIWRDRNYAGRRSGDQLYSLL